MQSIWLCVPSILPSDRKHYATKHGLLRCQRPCAAAGRVQPLLVHVRHGRVHTASEDILSGFKPAQSTPFTMRHPKAEGFEAGAQERLVQKCNVAAPGLAF